MTFLYASLLILTMVIALVLTLLGLPGNWMMVAAAALYAGFGPVGARGGFGWKVVVVLVGLALLGELIEFVAGAMGVAKGGGSRRGAVFAIVGAMIGAIVGAAVGVPIPVIGPIIATILFAAVGAMIGAMIGEHSAGQTVQVTWQVGKSAFWGRLFGTLAKLAIGVVMVIVAIIAVLA